jgi:hypothetical protein
MSTNAPPRFRRTTARGHGEEFSNPLPGSLSAFVEDRTRQHGMVADRLAELRGRRIELARALAEQEAADERARADAVAAGRSPGRRQKAAAIRKRLAEVEDELHGFEDGIAKSADRLLEAAAPYREQAVAKAAEAQTAALARAQELLAATDAALAEAGELTAERNWLARLDGRQRIEPFRPGVSGDASLGQLRATLRDAFADWQTQHDRRQADFDQRQAFEADQEAQRLRHEDQARREDAARRVVTADGAIVEQGGRRVRQTGFGPQPVDEEEQR